MKDVHPGPEGSSPRILEMANGSLLFAANLVGGDSAWEFAWELWGTRGTSESTQLLARLGALFGETFCGHPFSSSLYLAFHGALYFREGSTGDCPRIWVSDGTPEGTRISEFPLVPGPHTNIDGTLFVLAEGGQDLWLTDGTTEGTFLYHEALGHPADWSPGLPTQFDGALFFAAANEATGRELWTSADTPEGTSLLVKDIHPGPEGSDPDELTEFRDRLFFSADGGKRGRELWVSDGTPEGTVLFTDIQPGSAGASPGDLTVVDGRLFFTADDGVNGQELWVSDGTPEGTHMVRDIHPGAGVEGPSELTAVEGRLAFSADDGEHGRELWVSDGTENGTCLVADIWPGVTGSKPSGLTEMNGSLYFAADDGFHGRELWASVWPETPPVLPVDCNADGALDISDGICLLGHLFLGEPANLSCGDGTSGDPANVRLLDANGDRTLDLSDAVYVLGFLVLGTQPPVLGADCVAISGCVGVCAP